MHFFVLFPILINIHFFIIFSFKNLLFHLKIVIQYACFRIGAILCTVNPFYQSYELDYAIRKGEMKALFMPGHKSRQDIVNRFSTITMKTLEKKADDQVSVFIVTLIN